MGSLYGARGKGVKVALNGRNFATVCNSFELVSPTCFSEHRTKGNNLLLNSDLFSYMSGSPLSSIFMKGFILARSFAEN